MSGDRSPPTPPAPSPSSSGAKPRVRAYVPVRYKLILVTLFATAWLVFSIVIAQPWVRDLATLTSAPLAWLIVIGIALIPGFASAFLFCGLLFDRRPRFRPLAHPPPVTVIIAAYNEESSIAETLASFALQRYAALLEILVVDDGSQDRTAEVVSTAIAETRRPASQTWRLIRLERNGGKAGALNRGLAEAQHHYLITVDADTVLYRDAIANLVANQLQSPPRTAATAGTVLVRNSRKNLLTRLQEWDYFLGIAVVKRIQSLLQGTLVAQGAFSIYRKSALLEVGGWPETVGEDIVLTWALMEAGYRVGYAENAFVFTNVPENYNAFYRQRKRWSRGLIEAFLRFPRVLVHPRLNTPFVYLNLTFPLVDFAYLFFFIPGVLAALFYGYYAIAGVMTLLLIPLMLLTNSAMFFKQRAVFRHAGLHVRSNWAGLVMFTLGYQLLMAPASLAGYTAELLSLKKSW